jgi:hypothetical protein
VIYSSSKRVLGVCLDVGTVAGLVGLVLTGVGGLVVASNTFGHLGSVDPGKHFNGTGVTGAGVVGLVRCTVGRVLAGAAVVVCLVIAFLVVEIN